VAQTKSETKVVRKASEPNRFTRYFRETRGELRKVTWPTREESQRLTAIVLGVSLVMALFLGIWDYVFSTLVNGLITLLAGT
jgi:preprotein translocase subunit SecE